MLLWGSECSKWYRSGISALHGDRSGQDSTFASIASSENKHNHEAAGAACPTYDMIVASDVLYHESMMLPILLTLMAASTE